MSGSDAFCTLEKTTPTKTKITNDITCILDCSQTAFSFPRDGTYLYTGPRSKLRALEKNLKKKYCAAAGPWIFIIVFIISER